MDHTAADLAAMTDEQVGFYARRHGWELISPTSGIYRWEHANEERSPDFDSAYTGPTRWIRARLLAAVPVATLADELAGQMFSELGKLHRARREHPDDAFLEGAIAALRWLRDNALPPSHRWTERQKPRRSREGDPVHPAVRARRERQRQRPFG